MLSDDNMVIITKEKISFYLKRINDFVLKFMLGSLNMGQNSCKGNEGENHAL